MSLCVYILLYVFTGNRLCVCVNIELDISLYIFFLMYSPVDSEVGVAQAVAVCV